MKHVLALDGLRGIAILSVLLFHFNLPGHPEAGILKGGYLGVDIFFVLSGFLITSVLLDEYYAVGRISLVKFYAKRALRLLPALIVVLLFSFLYVHFFGNELQRTKVIRGVFSTFFYYSNWINAYEAGPLGFLNHTWSLAVEEQFYFCWPLTLLVLLGYQKLNRNLCLILLALILLSLGIKIYYASHSQFLRAYAGTDARLDALLIGCLVAYLNKNESPLLRMLARPLVFYVMSAIAILMLVFSFYDSMFMYCGGYTLFAFMIGIVIGHIVVVPHGSSGYLLRASPLRFMGKISYGVYLWHLPCFAIYSDLLGVNHIMARNYLAVATSIAVATLSYFFVEEPFLKFKSRLR